MSYAFNRRFGDALLARRLDAELLTLFDHVLSADTSAGRLWLGARLVTVRELVVGGVTIEIEGAGALTTDGDFLQWSRGRYGFPFPPFPEHRALE